MPPPQRGNRLGNVPEGLPATDFQSINEPVNGYTGGRRFNQQSEQGGMRKSQSFAGVQQPLGQVNIPLVNYIILF